MTAVLAVIAKPRLEQRWAPLIDVARYDRSVTLTDEERETLGLLAEHRYRWPTSVATRLARLTAPIHDALDVIELASGLVGSLDDTVVAARRRARARCRVLGLGP